MFFNFVTLFNVNYDSLWLQSIEPILAKSRETGEPLDVNYLQNGFRDIENWSRCYTNFHLAHSDSLKHIQKKLKESENFRDFVTVSSSNLKFKFPTKTKQINRKIFSVGRSAGKLGSSEADRHVFGSNAAVNQIQFIAESELWSWFPEELKRTCPCRD